MPWLGKVIYSGITYWKTDLLIRYGVGCLSHELLDMLYRNQHLAYEPAGAQSLREGAAMAVRLADQIRAIDDQLSAKTAAR